jgi:hypothetical protein
MMIRKFGVVPADAEPAPAISSNETAAPMSRMIRSSLTPGQIRRDTSERRGGEADRVS